MNEEKRPEDPFGQYTGAAIAMHEMMTSFVAAGFTRSEAVDLTKAIVLSTIKGSK